MEDDGIIAPSSMEEDGLLALPLLDQIDNGYTLREERIRRKAEGFIHHRYVMSMSLVLRNLLSRILFFTPTFFVVLWKVITILIWM